MNRTLLQVVLVSMSVLALAAATQAAPAPKKPAKVTLALNWKAEPEFGGFYAAKLNGTYEKKGLDVAILEGGAGTPVIQMVAAGKVEYGISSADEVALSRDRGTDVIALFAVYKDNPQGIMVHPDRGFKSIGDVLMNEGTLAIQLGLPHTQYLQAKYPKAKAKLVPYQGGVAPFLADPKLSQQCFVTSEPQLVKKQGKKAASFLIASEGFNPYTAVVITRKKTLDKDPEQVKAMVEAIREGWRDYLASPDQANEHMAGLNKSMDLATFKEIAELQKPFVVPADDNPEDLGKMSAERWTEISRQLAELKLIRKKRDGAEYFKNL